MNFSGLDTHKESVVVHKVDGEAKDILSQHFGTGNLELERLYENVKDSECVLEAGSTCYPIYDFLTSRGVKVKVADPRILKSNCGLKKKTDKVDAKKMALMLRAGFIPEAHIPTNFVRIDRDLFKQHIFLTKQKTREINKVKSILLRYRIQPEKSNLFGKKTNWLDDCQISSELKLVLQQSLDKILLFQQQKKNVDKLIEEKARKNNDAVLLNSIPGVGWFTAFLVCNLIDGVERFHSVEQLISYAGLSPSVYQSGNKTYLGRISKQGRPELRWILVQCAWITVKKSKRFRKKFLKLKRKKGVKKAIVATAKKLLNVMYFLLKKKESYREDA